MVLLKRVITEQNKAKQIMCILYGHIIYMGRTVRSAKGMCYCSIGVTCYSKRFNGIIRWLSWELVGSLSTHYVTLHPDVKRYYVNLRIGQHNLSSIIVCIGFIFWYPRIMFIISSEPYRYSTSVFNTASLRVICIESYGCTAGRWNLH